MRSMHNKAIETYCVSSSTKDIQYAINKATTHTNPPTILRKLRIKIIQKEEDKKETIPNHDCVGTLTKIAKKKKTRCYASKEEYTVA